MFQLHDKTRRRICLTGFFLLCVVPTLGAAAWCIVRHLPWTAKVEAQSLTHQLGLEARISDLRFLRPGMVLYEGFELADPETGQRLLRCRVIEVQWQQIADKQGKNKTMIVLLASQPEIEISGLHQLGGLLQRAMQRQTGRIAVDLRVSAGELTLQSGGNSHTLTSVEANLDNLPGGVQAGVSFKLAGMDMPQPVKIRVVRNRQTVPPASGFEIHTGSGELPCELLAAGLPELGALGPRCRFRGYIWANQDPGGSSTGAWSGEATGQFFNVDLGPLISDNFPHKLSGAADVTIQSARFTHSRLQEANGAVVAGPGVISRSLLEAAVKHLGFRSSSDPGLLADQVQYDQLSAALFLDSRGLLIEGRCTSTQPGVVMIDRRLCLLSEPVNRPQPVTALIRTLAPESSLQVPATNQTDWLVSHLPMPDAVAPTAREATLPSAHLRLRQE